MRLRPLFMLLDYFARNAKPGDRLAVPSWYPDRDRTAWAFQLSRLQAANPIAYGGIFVATVGGHVVIFKKDPRKTCPQCGDIMCPRCGCPMHGVPR